MNSEAYLVASLCRSIIFFGFLFLFLLRFFFFPGFLFLLSVILFVFIIVIIIFPIVIVRIIILVEKRRWFAPRCSHRLLLHLFDFLFSSYFLYFDRLRFRFGLSFDRLNFNFSWHFLDNFFLSFFLDCLFLLCFCFNLHFGLFLCLLFCLLLSLLFGLLLGFFFSLFLSRIAVLILPVLFIVFRFGLWLEKLLYWGVLLFNALSLHLFLALKDLCQVVKLLVCFGLFLRAGICDSDCLALNLNLF